MRTEPESSGNASLYWLVALAVICGALVLAGMVREACMTLSGSLEAIAR